MRRAWPSDLGRTASVVRRRQCGSRARKYRSGTQVPRGNAEGRKLRECRQRRSTAGVLAQQAVHVRAADPYEFVLVEMRRLRQGRQQQRRDHGRDNLSAYSCQGEITQGRNHNGG
jgi:hypothetical protein